MSTNSVTDYTFAKSTPKLDDLSQKAGEETRAEAVAAKETPVSKLTYTSCCGEITAEYYRAHHKIPSIVAIESHYKPEVFALINGPIWIRPFHTAVVIPLLEFGGLKVTVTSRASTVYDVEWQPGSIHYLGGDVSLNISGGGRVVFIFLLFKMRQ